ncbi:hypothetical protein L2735_03415 [Shewanella olleyana]|uniref:hypothetical protein n=1 Tax=Shewanella olleyana TaxID=135626 RepID=UPI00200F92E5|nr:hypothetical protein [Shewanella olleyana]MCL1065855.1 hypothetical protein [Shewanella olleyana]
MSVKRNKNKRGLAYLTNMPTKLLSDTDIEKRCKFNFSYLHHSGEWGQDFIEWNLAAGNSSIVKLINKIKDYTKSSLEHWVNKPCTGGHVLKFYDRFPLHSNFSQPKSIPTDVEWGVFRLENKARLVGFRVSETTSAVYEQKYCTNTFYVVFLDNNHDFYPTTKRNT